MQREEREQGIPNAAGNMNVSGESKVFSERFLHDSAPSARHYYRCRPQRYIQQLY
jgi:hypothetical protein